MTLEKKFEALESAFLEFRDETHQQINEMVSVINQMGEYLKAVGNVVFHPPTSVPLAPYTIDQRGNRSERRTRKPKG